MVASSLLMVQMVHPSSFLHEEVIEVAVDRHKDVLEESWNLFQTLSHPCYVQSS